MKIKVFTALFILLKGQAAQFEVLDVTAIDTMPMMNDLDVELITRPPYQYAIYFNGSRHLTIAQRNLDSSTWHYTSLNKGTTMKFCAGIGPEGNLHIVEEAFHSFIKYYRTTSPGDLTTLIQLPVMNGIFEESVSSPHFFSDRGNNFFFSYRMGPSGRGTYFVKSYDPDTRTWKSTSPSHKAIVDGTAFSEGVHLPKHSPVLGPTGLWHFCFLWVKNRGKRSAKSPIYLRTRDFKTWEDAFGNHLKTPLYPLDGKAGIEGSGRFRYTIPDNHTISFIGDDPRPVVTYLKSAPTGALEIWVARPENEQWKIAQISNFLEDFPSKSNNLSEIEFWDISDVRMYSDEIAGLSWRTAHKSGDLFFKTDTLEPIEYDRRLPLVYPKELQRDPASSSRIHRSYDKGRSRDPDIEYIIQWEIRETDNSLNKTPLKMYKLKRVFED